MNGTEIFIARYVMDVTDEIPLSSSERVFSTKEKAIEWLNSEADENESVWYDDSEGEVHMSDSYIEEYGDDLEYDELYEGWHLYSDTID